MAKFPDFLAPTKVTYLERAPTTLHLRRCTLTAPDGRFGDRSFDKEVVRIGSMEDNDLVIDDDTVSRYHCKVVQQDTGYALIDLGSTNGTFINNVRIREAFLTPGCVINVGQSQLRWNALEQEVAIVPPQVDSFGFLIGGNPRMRELYAIIEKIAGTATTVVIEGETGTGKEVVAQTIHSMSPRARGEMVVFDCGAVPANLIESELFGHEKGSFTGAVTTRQGLFEQADGGTLFLDELGELPLDLQPKLLRVLEQREVRRVGGAKPSKVDVRIIAATNRTLEEEVRAGRFRQDLFYRLSVVRLQLPALRERADDIPLLVDSFLRKGRYNQTEHGPKVRRVAPEAMALMQQYDWPGNVRELVNVIERAVSFAATDTLTVEDLPESVQRRLRRASTAGVSLRASSSNLRAATSNSMPAQRLETDSDNSWSAAAGDMPELPNIENTTFKDGKEFWIATFERDYIAQLLRRHGGNISHAARDADIDRKYFRKLMKKYAIEAADAMDDGTDD